MKIALIGNGYWGSKIRHYTPEFFDLKYIVDSKFDKSIIWRDKDVEAVIIATPIETHYEITKEALLNGKHVFCEKPISLCSIQAKELKAIAKKRDLVICVDYTYTFSPFLSYFVGCGDLDYIEMGTKQLGRFLEYDAYWLLASHHLAILDMFIDIDKLSFRFKDHICNGDVCTTGSIFFDKGKIDVSLNHPGKEVFVNFYGNKRLVKYRPVENKCETIAYNNTYGHLSDDLITDWLVSPIDEHNNIRHAIKYFVDAIEGKVESNMDRAIKITKILERR